MSYEKREKSRYFVGQRLFLMTKLYFEPLEAAVIGLDYSETGRVLVTIELELYPYKVRGWPQIVNRIKYYQTDLMKWSIRL